MLELQALDRRSPSLQPERLQGVARRLLVDLSKACGDVPVELYVDGTIEDVSMRRVRVGGFAEIYSGLLHGRPVALKRFHHADDLPVRTCMKTLLVLTPWCD